MQISHEEAQELHEIIGTVLLWLVDADPEEALRMERARELAAIIVSDTDPDNMDHCDSCGVVLTEAAIEGGRCTNPACQTMIVAKLPTD